MIHDNTFNPATGKTKLNQGRKRKHAKRRKISFAWMDEPHNPVRGEMALWVAVITQAMMDALSRSRGPEAQYYKHEAINWLTGNSRNFKTVCALAGLDHSYVRSRAKKALVSPAPWRAEAGTGKRYEERKAYRNRLKQQETDALSQSPCPEPQLA